MLVTAASNRRNQTTALIVAGIAAALILVLGCFNPYLLIVLPLTVGIYWFIRRRTLRRRSLARLPFPQSWESILQSHVDFFRALDEPSKERFRNLVKVFLDETPISGVRTEVDEVTRVLVAASAVIPVFGFDDWEYSGLGEVLIYPRAFDSEYQTGDGAQRTTLGMIGVKHLSGVMILSKPDLVAGFANAKDKRNVGIHEFSHLVDKADGSVDGIPAGIPAAVVRPWIGWVASELKRPAKPGEHIDDYAFTNDAEYFAVLSEYFFEAPEVLARRAPGTYQMLQSMYRQDTRALFSKPLSRRGKRVGRNAACPCGSGKKYKRCCQLNRKRGLPGK